MIFDGEQLGDLMAPLDLGWKARTQAELSLMEDCVPYLIKRAGGRDISGLSAYEQEEGFTQRREDAKQGSRADEQEIKNSWRLCVFA